MTPTDPTGQRNGTTGTVVRLARVCLLCALIGAGVGVVIALLQDDTYSASTTVLIKAAQPTASDTDNDRSHRTSVALLTSEPVREQAEERLRGVADPGVLVDDVSVDVKNDSEVAVITAESDNRALPPRISDAYALAYLDVRRAAVRARQADLARSLEARAELLERSGSDQDEVITRILDRAVQLRILAAAEPANAQVIRQAERPIEADEPEIVLYGLLGGAAGLLVGALIVLLIGSRERRTLETGAEAEELLGAPLIAVVPRSPALASRTMAGALPGREAEAFRMLRASLRYLDLDRVIKTVLVTSPAQGDGKSTVAFNLAATAAAGGSSVLLIEADLRQPALTRMLGLPPGDGLAEMLLDRASLEASVRELPAPAGARDGGSLDVLPAGDAGMHAGQLLDDDQMRELLRQARESYDLVVVDTPPPSIVADAIPLLDQVDGVVVAVAADRTTIESARRLRETLRRAGANVAGVVANFVPPRPDPDGADHYYQPAGENGRRRRRRSLTTR